MRVHAKASDGGTSAPRLCIIVPAHWEAMMGGSQYQAKLLTEYLLERRDFDIHYLTACDKPGFRPTGYRILRFSDRDGLRRYGAFFDAFRLYRALRRVRPDVILQFVGCAHTGIAAFYAKRHGCDMIWRVSSDRSVRPERPRWWQVHRRIEQRFLEYGICNADRILAQSQYQREQLARRYRRNAAVLANFHPVPPDRAPARHRVECVVAWIANLKPLKNPEAFIRLARSFSDRSGVRFVMIGRAMLDDRWTRAVLAHISATPNIEYLGELGQDDVNRQLELSDLLVNTSDYEGFSNTFIQAWMRRVPVASLRVDPDGLLSQYGLGVVAGNEDRLRENVGRLLGATTERIVMGSRCRQYAITHHSESNLEEFMRVLSAPRPVEKQAPRNAAMDSL